MLGFSGHWDLLSTVDSRKVLESHDSDLEAILVMSSHPSLETGSRRAAQSDHKPESPPASVSRVLGCQARGTITGSGFIWF